MLEQGESQDRLELDHEDPLISDLLSPKETEVETALEDDTDHQGHLEIAKYDPLRHYLFEISKYEPLTQEEEQRLARLFREEQDLSAARALVTSNLKLVVKIAFLYNKVYSNLLDLIQEGNIGLLQAVKKFDPDRGTRLPTYASWWIKAYIIKFILDNFRIVKVGTTNDRRKVLLNLRKEKRRLEGQGITTTPQMLAEAMNVSEEDVVAVQKSIESHDISLDEKLSDDSNLYFLETLASTEELIDERLAAGELKQFIDDRFKEFSSNLSEKDRTILQERLIAEKPLTLQVIADRFGVTREAIRISEKKLVERIKIYMRKALRDVRDIDFQLGE